MCLPFEPKDNTNFLNIFLSVPKFLTSLGARPWNGFLLGCLKAVRGDVNRPILVRPTRLHLFDISQFFVAILKVFWRFFRHFIVFFDDF
jgi:hypothetical protein